jgi:peptide/nickel transport system permease protein
MTSKLKDLADSGSRASLEPALHLSDRSIRLATIMPRAWDIILRLIREPIGLLGLMLVVIIVSSAILADWIVPYDPIKINVRARLQSPSTEHLLGTDQMGRDVFSRAIMGGRIALKVALVSISIALAAGLILGLIAGYGPRWLDYAIILFFDTIRSFPIIMFALAVVTIVGPSIQTVMLVVIVASIPTYGRIVRSQTQSMKNTEFILAERAMGASMPRVLCLHMLPNIIGPLLIVASMDIPGVVAIEAGMSFLGFGVRPPTPSWGSILNDGYSFIRNTPWLAISAGVPLILTTLGFTFLGETLRDIFDPRLGRDK